MDFAFFSHFKNKTKYSNVLHDGARMGKIRPIQFLSANEG